MSRYTPQGNENALARSRARQRARNRIATHFKTEVIAAMVEMDPTGISRDGLEQRAVRLVARRHPRVFKRYLEVELAKETFHPLRRGAVPIFPHGTKQALIGHNRHGEPLCEVCATWSIERFGRQKCRICLNEFVIVQPGQRYCGETCKCLWAGYFRFHVEWATCRAYQLNSIVVNPENHTEGSVRNARQRLDEYRRTGTIERRRGPYNSYPLRAREMADEIGIDLDKTLKRLMKEAP